MVRSIIKLKKIPNRWRVAIAIGLIISGAAAFALYPRGQDLLSKSNRMTALSSDLPYYWWISDDEVMTVDSPKEGDLTFRRHNLTTGAVSVREALSTQFRQSGGKPDSAQISTDGSRLLWIGKDDTAHVASLDGKAHHTSSVSGTVVLRWLDDSRWVELIGDEELIQSAVIHSVHEPDKPKWKPIFPNIPSSPKSVNIAGIATTSDDHVLAHYWNRRVGDINPARIVAMGFSANPSVMGKFTVAPPRDDFDYGELIFGSRSGRLAWHLRFRPTLPLRSMAGIWIMDMNGLTARELGWLAAGWSGTRGPGPFNIQWTPSGEAISFIYEGALWKTDIE